MVSLKIRVLAVSVPFVSVYMKRNTNFKAIWECLKLPRYLWCLYACPERTVFQSILFPLWRSLPWTLVIVRQRRMWWPASAVALSPTVTGSVAMRLSLVGRHQALTTPIGRLPRLTESGKVLIRSGGEEEKVWVAPQRNAAPIGRIADIKVDKFNIGRFECFQGSASTKGMPRQS